MIGHSRRRDRVFDRHYMDGSEQCNTLDALRWIAKGKNSDRNLDKESLKRILSALYEVYKESTDPNFDVTMSHIEGVINRYYATQSLRHTLITLGELFGRENILKWMLELREKIKDLAYHLDMLKNDEGTRAPGWEHDSLVEVFKAKKRHERIITTWQEILQGYLRSGESLHGCF